MQVDNVRLIGLAACATKVTALTARDKLVDAGLVEYQQGKKGSPNQYRLGTFGIEYGSKIEPKDDFSLKIIPKTDVFGIEYGSKNRPHIKTKNNNIYNTPTTNTKRFIPPTFEEVQAYCTERGNNIDPEQFVDFYTANGWVQGKGKPIKDWKAAVRTWERNSKTEQSNNKSICWDK